LIGTHGRRLRLIGDLGAQPLGDIRE
jgi:hypothetical protein